MSSSDIAIRVTNLSKRYEIYDTPRDRLKQFVLPPLQRLGGQPVKQYFREFWALRDVSFEIKKGEAVGIIGRNGSGKSTLLQMICGTLNPTCGGIETTGRIAALLELGSGFSPEFTGRENVYMNAAVLGFSNAEIEARFDDIAAFADIGEFINQPVKTYSSGMLVRLAFAVQVCIDPDILIVDEALAVGDALFQKRCFERMERLTSNGTTLLFVSHDQESVRTLTNRAVLLRTGLVQMIGNSAETLLAYRKQLHEEETKALNESALALKEKAAKTRAMNRPSVVSTLPSAVDTKSVESISTESASVQTRSALLSFGDMEAEILKVVVLNAKGEGCSHFDPREMVRVVVECIAHQELTNLNVALRLRNKEGVKIYSWGTLNQDMAILAGLATGDVFWKRSFKAKERFAIAFDFVCGLGPNLHEVQAAITREGQPYYAEQHMLHWIDEAAFFTVTTNPREYHFGGVVDLKMSAQPVGNFNGI
ncbi:ABC transporter ATP-binding protein [Uliginosibacterium gangwonense]|uniref:ABC transporter ATP-binding protein n=1 Tax=Uliginosibacterium gangwonense TaxID=392736 RepID=UPI0003737737|nr:ABC transporter ATP-binding protein [Uliginosibacterium gangwonense]